MKTILFTIIISSIFMVPISYAQSIRKDYNEMTSDEIDAYVDALYDLRIGVDVIEELRQAHEDHMPDVHGDERFLPWHRLFVLELEEALQNINPLLNVPYWNWVTDNSATDPLWDQSFLGQFDDVNVWASLGRTLSAPPALPTQTDVDNVQVLSDFNQYRQDLESIHNDPHCWVGGIMCQLANSPLDPVFYLHHAVVDKLWQQWEDENQSSSFQSTSLPRYPNTDPNDITDSRDLNVWYAEDGVVMLDDYETSGTNDYAYTGRIESEDFTVASGSDVSFIAGNSVVLGPGFKTVTGSTFFANVDPGVGNILSKMVEEDQLVDRIDERQVIDTSIEWSLSQNYPNPFNPITLIQFTLSEPENVRLVVYDVMGREVTRLVDAPMEAGEHKVRFDGTGLSSGIYIYRIQAGDFVQSRRMTFIK